MGEVARAPLGRSSGKRPPKSAHGEGRTALMLAAIRVVARDGLRKLTYRAVAEEAGLTHGLVRHHFGSIDSLILEALTYCTDVSLANIDIDPPSGEVEDFLRGLFGFLRSDGETQVFQYVVMLESRQKPALQEAVAQMLVRYKQVVQDALTRMGITADTGTVEMVYATLEGVVLQESVRGHFDGVDSAIAKLRAVLVLMQAHETAAAPPGS